MNQSPSSQPVRIQGVPHISNLNITNSQPFILSPQVALQQLPSNTTQRFLHLTPRTEEKSINVGGLGAGTRAAAHPTLVSTLAGQPHYAVQNHENRKRRRIDEIVPCGPPNKFMVSTFLLKKAKDKRRKFATLLVERFANGYDPFYNETFKVNVQRRHLSNLTAYLRSRRLDPSDPDEDLLKEGTPDNNGETNLENRVSLSQIDKCQKMETSQTTSTIDVLPAKLIPSRPQTSTATSATTAYDAQLGNQELIAERVKQEAYVAQRISELQRAGLWAEKRLPKVQEPPRNKAHWDYLLEEMLWLSADFVQERKWKKANAKKCAKMVQKYFMDKESLQRKEEKLQEMRLRKIASFIAKEVKNFWTGVNKLVEHKQTTRLEEKRKQALDQHLSFIVDQTEKYSTWLAESMNKTGGGQTSASTSRPTTPNAAASDDDFQPNVSSSDDDETITKEEDENDADEGERLKREFDMPLDDYLSKYYSHDGDKDPMDSGSGEDLNVDDVDEPMEQIKESKPKATRKTRNTTHDSDDDTGTESEQSASETEADSDDSPDDDVSLKTLVENNKMNKQDADGEREKATKEINDVTAIAESIQPKGSTLQTANVATNVPFLVKHTLREYQHIGLDWLVTMFDRKLNGILADEMGLGKTIQTIALLAHLACEKENWGPHLIIVPTSVMLNWEMEFKKWCPAFKILTYYGTIKERKAKRSGWTKPNAFHICITSYKLVIQDHQSFRRKKWQYLVLDEAQNIKNFRSQRWQLLLNFQTSRRLLLTGTPLQNNLMELWSLMHFLMPNVFQSHREFKEWFSNPVTGMLEGNSEYNESIIKRLHKVLRPFLLRRLKTEVEKQLPKKYEHVIMCRLSNRQRYLYEDFMSRAKTKETLATGNLLSVINVLMQLRKVCNHPNLFETRPVISPFQMDGIVYQTASLVTKALDYNPDRHVNLDFFNLRLADYEPMTGLEAYMARKIRAGRRLIEEIDSIEERPRPPKMCLKLKVDDRKHAPIVPLDMVAVKNAARLAGLPAVAIGRSPMLRLPENHLPVKVPGSEMKLFPGATPVPVQLVQTAKGRQLFFPLPSASSSANPVIANGQRLSLGNLKSPQTSQETTEGQEPDKDGVESTPGTQSALTVVMSPLNPISMTVRTTKPDKVTTPLPLSQAVVEERRSAWRQARLRSVAAGQERRCERFPLYGADLVSAVRIVDEPPSMSSPADWRWSGSAACYALASQRLSPYHALWGMTQALTQAVRNPEQIIHHLRDVLSRFVVCVPAVNAPRLSMHVSHPTPSQFWQERRLVTDLVREVTPRCRLLHPIIANTATQFPDAHLIQYDCGKLQVLDGLLRRLKADHHKVLIFTQMTRMLDVLEAFLNYHGYIYLRLDGTTKVDQRQVLMERFNGDDRIFVFILSTRSGGIGVNLTGADTVIFYDSDWNPTMDAQAQDRCHRIGQTRDVHIYRLISEMTIEENILKKANQKRLLGDLAIEGGNFTTAYFKSSTIQDLFTVDTNEKDANKRMQQSLGGEREKKGTEEPENTGVEKAALGALESALATAEDATDVQAAQTATAEAAAELAEFDENIPIEDPAEPEMSRAEQELEQLVQMLKPIERYAIRYVEENEAAWSAEQLAAAEAQIEEQKREWEQNRQKAMDAEEARLREDGEQEQNDDDDDDELTYTREPSNEVWLNSRSIEGLAMWCPPTPPQELDDVYIDLNLVMLYEGEPLREADLPPIYVKKDLKRSRVQELPSNLEMRLKKISRREELPISAPRSLFDHPGSNIQKMKRDVKMKYRSPMTFNHHSPARIVSTTQRDENAMPEWSIQEEYVLLQTIESIQDLPLSLITSKPGHTPNWDLAADMVNKVSCTTRSALQCRNRFENYIIYREEGKLTVEYKRQKKTKNNYRPPTQKNFSTKRLNQQDNNKTFTEAYNQRFDNINKCAHNRKPNPKPLLSNSQNKQKLAAVIRDSGVMYDTPLSPIEIALRRADRIAKEKKQIQSQALTAQAAQVQNVAAAAAAAAAAATVATPSPTHSITADQLTTQQQRQLVVAAQTVGKTLQFTPVPVSGATVNVAVTLANNVVASTPVVTPVVTTVVSTQPATPTSIVVASGQTVNALPSLTPALRQARPVSTIPIQEIQTATVSQARTVSTTTTATVVSVASFTPAQLQAARLASGSLVHIPTSSVKVVNTAGGNTLQMASTSKSLSTAQFGYFKGQPTFVRTNAAGTATQPRIGMRDQAQVKMVQGQPKVAQIQNVTAAQGKTQLLKQASVMTAKVRADEVTLVKQQLQRHQKQTQSPVTGPLLPQTGLQVQHNTATLAKSLGQNMIPIPTIATVPQVKGAITSQLKTVTGSQPMPMRLSLPPSYLVSKQTRPTKVTQLGKTIPSMQTQYLLQSSQGNKAIGNVQQLQNLMKSSQSHPMTVSVAAVPGVAGAGHVVLAKAGTPGTSSLSSRVLPTVSGAGRQTYQVLPAATRVSGVTQVSVPSGIAGSLKMTGNQQAFISQVTGLQNIVRQSGINPIRIQSSPTAGIMVTMPQQNQQNSDQGNS